MIEMSSNISANSEVINLGFVRIYDADGSELFYDWLGCKGIAVGDKVEINIKLDVVE